MASRWMIGLIMLGGAVAAQQVNLERMPQPQYAGDELLRPEGYREWMFVASNLGMGYTEGAAPRNPTFHNIFMQREAWREYAATGRFPDKTMLVMEVVTPGTNASINRQGQFQERLRGIEVALKDEKRFPEKWAYFNFIGSNDKPLAQAKAFPKKACWSCHNEHGQIDNVFVQFYPLLRERINKQN